jgi:hypothetical protein
MERSRSIRRHFTERVKNRLNKRIYSEWKWHKNRRYWSDPRFTSFLTYRKMYLINEGKGTNHRCRCERCLSNRHIQWSKEKQKLNDDYLDYFD